jgi:hypothetical protein
VSVVVDGVVDPELVLELWAAGVDGLQLDGHVVPGRSVDTLVDVPEGPATELAAGVVAVRHPEIHAGRG